MSLLAILAIGGRTAIRLVSALIAIEMRFLPSPTGRVGGEDIAEGHMETRFAFRIQESYRMRRRGASGVPGTRGVHDAKVTPVSIRAMRGVILSQRPWCAGGGYDGAHEIRCAPDLILAQGERMYG